jgi:hypothetical protein
MQALALPWEASRTCLDLLAYFRQHHMGKPPSGIDEDIWKRITPDRPTNEFMEWYWRVTQAAPSASIPIRLLITVTVRLGELEHAEACLAYAPWESEAHASAYAAAISEKKIPPFSVESPYPDRRMTRLFSMFGTHIVGFEDINSTWTWLAKLSGWEPNYFWQRQESTKASKKGTAHGSKRSQKG